MRKYIQKFQVPGATKLGDVSGKPQGSKSNEKAKASVVSGIITSPYFKTAVDNVKSQFNSDWSQKTTFGGNVTNTLSKYDGLISGGLDLMSSTISPKNDTAYDEQQQIGNMLLKSKNPYVKAAGVAYKALSFGAEAMGTNVSKLNNSQTQAANISGAGKVFNNIAALIPGMGVFGKTGVARKSMEIDKLGGDYSGSVDDINVAGTMAGKNYIFGRRKANRFIDDSNRKQDLMTDISVTNTLRKQSDSANTIAQQNLNRYNNGYRVMAVGKKCMKLLSIDAVKEILDKKNNQFVEKFQVGGILPTGKLHKELNHISENNPDIEVTRKGIPVVALDEGGELEQVAEIERDEWTLNLETTQKIEALWKQNTDESAIEAGKIIVEALLYNTQDNGGLLNE